MEWGPYEEHLPTVPEVMAATIAVLSPLGYAVTLPEHAHTISW